MAHSYLVYPLAHDGYWVFIKLRQVILSHLCCDYLSSLEAWVVPSNASEREINLKLLTDNYGNEKYQDEQIPPLSPCRQLSKLLFKSIFPTTIILNQRPNYQHFRFLIIFFCCVYLI